MNDLKVKKGMKRLSQSQNEDLEEGRSKTVGDLEEQMARRDAEHQSSSQFQGAFLSHDRAQ